MLNVTFLWQLCISHEYKKRQDRNTFNMCALDFVLPIQVSHVHMSWCEYHSQGAVVTRSNAVWYCIHHCVCILSQKIYRIWKTKRHPITRMLERTNGLLCFLFLFLFCFLLRNPQFYISVKGPIGLYSVEQQGIHCIECIISGTVVCSINDTNASVLALLRQQIPCNGPYL